MSENKTGRYFKYAIGEIILVVIGILIALQINNWNEGRKAKLRSLDYHSRLIEDLNRIAKKSEQLHKTSYKVLNSINTTVNLMDQGKMPNAEEKEIIDYAFIWVSRFNYQLDELATYEEMKSSGELNLLYNIVIRDGLVNFYDYLLSADAIFNRLGTEITENISMFDNFMRSSVNPESLEIKNVYDFEAMSADSKFINQFSRLAVHWRANAFFTNQISKRANALANAIKEELKKK